MYVVYPSIFSKEKEGYSVHFPDLGGATCGSDLKDAYYMATDYIGTVLMEDFLEKKELPKATEIEKIDIRAYFETLYDKDTEKKEIEEAVKNSYTTLVGLDLLKYVKETQKTTVRKNVTIPSWLNETAKRYNLNFSKVLQEALEKELEIE